MSLTTDLAQFLTEPEHGNTFNPKAWEPTGEFKLRFEREFAQHVTNPMLRQHVFAKAQGRTLRGIWWALVWGYPRGKQAGDDKSLKQAMSWLENMVIVVDVLRQETPDAAKMLERLNFGRAGLSTASTTKIAYFCGLTTVQGPALIFDQQAMTAILERNDPEFAPLLASPPFAKNAGCARNRRVELALQQPEHYREYLSAMHKLSAQIGVPAQDIERFLYMDGRDVRKKEGSRRGVEKRAAKRAAALSVHLTAQLSA